jgi:glucose dehydrogenase
MSDPTHTPLPWKASDSGTGIWSANEPLGKNKIIAICSCDAVSRSKDENTANADFILRACNSHYELLAALEACRNIVYRHGQDHQMDILDAAIAKAQRAQ